MVKNKKKTFATKYLEYSYVDMINYIENKYENLTKNNLVHNEHDFDSHDFQVNNIYNLIIYSM